MRVSICYNITELFSVCQFDGKNENLSLFFLPVAWIDQSMPPGEWHGLNNPCHREKNHIYSYYDPDKDGKIQRTFLYSKIILD